MCRSSGLPGRARTREVEAERSKFAAGQWNLAQVTNTLARTTIRLMVGLDIGLASSAL